MILLVSGLAIWWAAHLFKRVAPDARAPMGETAKGPISLILLLSVVLMVFGYRAADGAVFWGRTPALTGINNLLMVAAFYIYAAGGPKGAKVWLGTKLRHPQLLGFSLWCVAHLLVNGDVPSFVLWGGLLLWAGLEVALINRAEGPWTPPPRRPLRSEFVTAGIAFVLFVLVAAIHAWLGYNPFG